MIKMRTWPEFGLSVFLFLCGMLMDSPETSARDIQKEVKDASAQCAQTAVHYAFFLSESLEAASALSFSDRVCVDW